MPNEDILDTFIAECGDHLRSVENDLIEMEREGAGVDQELINRVFRAAHSIKGGAGFFDLFTIKELAHRLENVLQLIRSRSLVPNPEVVNQLLLGFDKLKALVDDIERANDIDIADEVVALTGLASSYLPPERKTEAVDSVRFAAPGGGRELAAGRLELEAAREAGNGLSILRCDLIHDVQRLGKTPLQLLKSLEANGAVLDCAVDFKAVGDLAAETIASELPFFVLYATKLTPSAISEATDIPVASIAAVESPPTPKAAANAAPTTAAKAAPIPRPVSAATAEKREADGTEGEGTVRIPVAILDKLMNIAGELVLARNELLEAIGDRDASAIQNAGRRVDVVTREMQEAVMLTRMQPVGNLFDRFPRIVRDIARDTGKMLALSVSGRETEVDKTILEQLSDPLTHLLRNACDHGIEAPEKRTAAGKPPTGTIRLAAHHEAGNIVVEVRDDGGGIDVDAVAEKAVSMGLVGAERIKLMNVKEKSALILLPGLSTAKTITDMSGRGVGMDVVKTNIDKLGGQIEISTERGVGTTFKIKMPLTLAIIPSLLVSVGDERYALPEINVEELLRIRAGDVKNRIERIGDRSVLLLRGSFLPLIRLADVLGIPRSFRDPATNEKLPDRRRNLADRRTVPVDGDDLPARSGEDRRYRAVSDFSVAVVNSAALRYALAVDELHDTMEIVVKPLGRHFRALREYSGATILGNGSTALIIDTTGVATKAGLTSVESRPTDETTERRPAEAEERHTLELLLFRNGDREQCAVPLEAVERVKRIERKDIDFVGKTRVVTHEGASLPVFALNDVLDVSDILAGGGELALIIAQAAGKRFGLLASPPVDSIASDAAVDDASLAGRGIAGSAVIQGKTTILPELSEFIRIVKPEWFRAASDCAERETDSETPAGRVLVADDSDFFRTTIKDLLAEAGYAVSEAKDGGEALAAFQAARNRFDAIVADIEMPGLDGFALAKRIRTAGGRVPIIALTALAAEDDRRRAMDAGIDSFLVKLDKDELLATLEALIGRNIHIEDKEKRT